LNNASGIFENALENRCLSDTSMIATSVHAAQHGVIMAKKTLLIVDDNRDAADSLAMLLEIKGHKVLTAYDAETGLEVAHQASPDVIIHDINLPQMNGYVAAGKLRQDANCSGVILVALTGFARPGDRQRALAAGYDFHMAKPLDFAVLKRILSPAEIL
jgi:CheY-like chemotaxis protein